MSNVSPEQLDALLRERRRLRADERAADGRTRRARTCERHLRLHRCVLLLRRGLRGGRLLLLPLLLRLRVRLAGALRLLHLRVALLLCRGLLLLPLLLLLLLLLPRVLRLRGGGLLLLLRGDLRM